MLKKIKYGFGGLKKTQLLKFQRVNFISYFEKIHHLLKFAARQLIYVLYVLKQKKIKDVLIFFFQNIIQNVKK